MQPALHWCGSGHGTPPPPPPPPPSSWAQPRGSQPVLAGQSTHGSEQQYKRGKYKCVRHNVKARHGKVLSAGPSTASGSAPLSPVPPSAGQTPCPRIPWRSDIWYLWDLKQHPVFETIFKRGTPCSQWEVFLWNRSEEFVCVTPEREIERVWTRCWLETITEHLSSRRAEGAEHLSCQPWPSTSHRLWNKRKVTMTPPRAVMLAAVAIVATMAMAKGQDVSDCAWHPDPDLTLTPAVLYYTSQYVISQRIFRNVMFLGPYLVLQIFQWCLFLNGLSFVFSFCFEYLAFVHCLAFGRAVSIL